MKQIKKILCAVDFSQFSSNVAAYTSTLAKACDAEVLVVYAAPSLSQYVGFHVPPNTIETFVGEIVSGADEKMKDFIDKEMAGVRVEGRVLVGYAAEAIVKTAVDESCDLVILGTHGRKGIDRIIFGSVAEKVLQNSRIPVLTVRPQ